MVCYFCKKSSHVSEYCPEFQTLRQRNIQDRRKRNCLCDDPKPDRDVLYNSRIICSNCKIICKACFQHHHIAMCPKKDPFHPLNPIIVPEPFDLFSLKYAIVRRYFELCNPIDQHKLKSSCTYFQNLPMQKLKLDYRYSQPHPYQNIVFNGTGNFHNTHKFATLQLDTKSYFNFDSISLQNCSLTKADLKFLAKNDPHSVALIGCTLWNISFQDILNGFQYATEFKFIDQEIPSTWILNFLTAERNVDFGRIELEEDNDPNFDFDDLVNLFEQNKTLSLVITIKGRKYLTDVPICNIVLSSRRFVSSNYGGKSDLCFRTSDGQAIIFLNYLRSSVFY